MKNKSLLTKVVVTSLIVAAVTVILSGFILFTLFFNRAESNMEKNLKYYSTKAAYNLISYQSIVRLILYWREHYEDMSLPPFGSYDAYFEWVVKHSEFDRINVTSVTDEEFSGMEEEKQLLFAEYCYLKIFFELLQCQYQWDIDSIVCYDMNGMEENKAFVYFVTAEEYKSCLEDRVSLGDVWIIDPDKHPELTMLIRTDESVVNSGIELFHSESDGNDYASVYSLIGRNRKFCAVLAVTVSVNEMMEGVWSDVFGFEKWFILVLLIAIAVPLLIFYLSSLRPMLKLQRNIRSYTIERSSGKLYGELEYYINRGDEIGRLAEDVREMIKQNESYYNKQIENEKLKTEILMAQIKPHFIFNCLSAIRSLMDEPEKAEETLNHFAGFLRGSIDMLEETGCIYAKREFETVDNYLYMEKQRFGDRLCIETDIKESDFFLPAFSVQILAENAVNHGIRNSKSGKGTVYIRSYREDGFHVVEVEDDGAGMMPETMEKHKQEEMIHIGLKNTEKRLRMMCGGTLTIQSEAGKGTLVVIRIPENIVL